MKLELSNLAGRIRLIGVLLVHRIVVALARVRALGPLLVAGFVVALARLRGLGPLVIAGFVVALARLRGLGPLVIAGFVVALARLRQLGSFLVSRAVVEVARAWQGLSMAVAELARLHRDGPRLLWRAVPTLTAIALLVASMGGRWRLASASPKGTLAQASTVPEGPVTHPRSSKASGPLGTRSPSVAPQSATVAASPSGGADGFEDGAAPQRPVKKSRKELSGKLNLNSATEDQLMLLPTVGPAKAERIVTWRKKNGGFRRTADLRRVKGFGYKTFKRLQPFLDIEGDTSLH